MLFFMHLRFLSIYLIMFGTFILPHCVSPKWQVEVKGPNDKLAERQRAWLQILQEGGVMARVCKVHEGSKKQRKVG